MSTAWNEPVAPRRGFAQSRITLVYAAVGTAWIAVSDRALEALGLDPVTLSAVQTMKGWFYVAATTALLYALVRSVTHRLERANRELLEKDRALRTLLGNVPGVVYRCKNDADWTMEFLSDGCEKVTGYPTSALRGNRAVAYEELIDPRDRARVREAVDRAVARDEPFSVVYRIESAGGAERWVSEQGRAVDEGRFLEGLISDISDLKRMEERLERGQRMERLGDMAGGIAHDFNNYLTVITAYAEMLSSRSDLDAANRESIEHILAATERAGGLTEQLLAFARKRPRATSTIDAGDLISGLEPLLSRLTGPAISFALSRSPHALPVRFDPVQLEQVLMNLVANARDAIEDRGAITVEATLVDLRIELAEEAELEPGRYLCIAVRDTGAGIPDDALPHIFEPYFSTKRERGTGLGLATVYGAVKQAGGGIIVKSAAGEGTSFELYLPPAEGDASWLAARRAS